jgi:hypothetical protein
VGSYFVGHKKARVRAGVNVYIRWRYLRKRLSARMCTGKIKYVDRVVWRVSVWAKAGGGVVKKAINGLGSLLWFAVDSGLSHGANLTSLDRS